MWLLLLAFSFLYYLMNKFTLNYYVEYNNNNNDDNKTKQERKKIILANYRHILRIKL